MHWLDVLIIVLLISYALYGITRTFIRGLVSLMFFCIGALLASRYSSFGPQFLKDLWNIPWLNNILGFITIFAAAILLSILAGKLFHAKNRSKKSTPLENLLGLLVGLLKGGVVVVSILFCLNKFFPNGEKLISHTKVVRKLEPLSDWLAENLPAYMKSLNFPKNISKHLSQLSSSPSKRNRQNIRIDTKQPSQKQPDKPAGEPDIIRRDQEKVQQIIKDKLGEE